MAYAASDLYKACRDGKVEVVEQLLPTLSIEAINQLEKNGSTALHAASYYGHIDIVRLLLKHGARRNLLNKYQLTPADEAQTPDIKQLFNRSPTEQNQRFVTTTSHEIEWVRSGVNVREISLFNVMYAVSFKNLKEPITRICESVELHDINKKEINEIRFFLKQARDKNDPSYLLRAYTAETSFYHYLNRLLASIPFHKYTDEDRQKWYVQFAATVGSKDQYTKYGYKGICYRGMSVTENNLANYQVGAWMVNKAFLSTSKNRQVAESFITERLPNHLGVICQYNIQRDYDAFEISSISEYSHEEEILIFPNTPFQVTSINIDVEPVEIQLS